MRYPTADGVLNEPIRYATTKGRGAGCDGVPLADRYERDGWENETPLALVHREPPPMLHGRLSADEYTMPRRAGESTDHGEVLPEG
jgi:hypothetical protein